MSHTNGEDKTKGCGGNLQEKQKKYRKFLWYSLVGTLLSLFILIYGTMKDHIPDEIFVYADEETDWETFFQEPLISYDETVEVSQNGSYQIRCKWLGVLPLKTIKVHTVEKQEVLVSGSPVGIYMETKGVLVIDSGEITDREGIRRTPAEHIIQSGDYICEIDGKVLTGKRQLMQLVRENQGEPMELQVIRHQETIKLEMTPVETEDGSYKRVNPEEKNNYFVDIYKFILDFVDNDVKVQPEEVEGFKIATLEEIRAFAQEGIFLHYDSMKEVFD